MGAAAGGTTWFPVEERLRKRGRDPEPMIVGRKPVELSARWAGGGMFHWEDLVALTVLRQVLKEGRSLRWLRTEQLVDVSIVNRRTYQEKKGWV